MLAPGEMLRVMLSQYEAHLEFCYEIKTGHFLAFLEQRLCGGFQCTLCYQGLLCNLQQNFMYT